MYQEIITFQDHDMTDTHNKAIFDAAMGGEYEPAVNYMAQWDYGEDTGNQLVSKICRQHWQWIHHSACGNYILLVDRSHGYLTLYVEVE